MNRTNVVRGSLMPQGQLLSGTAPGRLTQIRAYQQLARVRLRERLSGNPTSAALYDLLMRDQLAFIRLSAPATHA